MVIGWIMVIITILCLVVIGIDFARHFALMKKLEGIPKREQYAYIKKRWWI